MPAIAPRAAEASMDRSTLDWVVTAAGRAPSIHNTQPWRWQLRADVLELRADRSRQLHVADRDGHSLLVSCGAAVELTELALHAVGWTVATTVLPDAADGDLLATFRLLEHGGPDHVAVARVTAARGRRSERRVFAPGAVSAHTIDELVAAAAAPGVFVHVTTRPDEALDLAVAVSQADRAQRDDPAYVAEMASWVRVVGSSDGVPVSAIPVVDGDEPRHTDIPLRDFATGVPGSQLVSGGVDERPHIAVVLTANDTAADRLLGGRAMMRLMIDAELAGLSSCPLSQSIDLLAFRTRLRTLMSWDGHPQMMLRIGRRPLGPPAPLTPRRATAEVLTELR